MIPSHWGYKWKWTDGSYEWIGWRAILTDSTVPTGELDYTVTELIIGKCIKSMIFIISVIYNSTLMTDMITALCDFTLTASRILEMNDFLHALWVENDTWIPRYRWYMRIYAFMCYDVYMHMIQDDCDITYMLIMTIHIWCVLV